MSSTNNTLGDMGSRVTLADISPPSTPPRTNGRKARARDESEEKPCSSKIPLALPSPPASPLPNRPKPTNEDKTSAKDHSKPSVAELRARLGINSGKCGCTDTSTGNPCKIKQGYKEADINTQIEAVRNCSNSSPKLLRDELYNLAGLVHCTRHHNFPIKKQPRVDIWRNEFDIKGSIEEQIEKMLQHYSITCFGMRKDGNPCQYKIGGWRVETRAKTIDIILNPDTYLDDKMLEYFLQVLKVDMFCRWHISYQGSGKVAAWKGEIQKIRERNCFNPPEDEGSTTQPTSLLPDRDPANYWTHEYDTTPFEINCSDISNDFKSSFREIRETLERPLELKEQEKGYIYAYEVDGNAGFVKIGYTFKPPRKRHEEWDRDCNRKPIALYPISSTPRVKVPNPHRVEELCHAELRHRNIHIACYGCQKTHIEWFQVSPEEAIAVIQKWSRWMLTSPYQPEPPEKSWRLKKKESKRIKDIDQFMKGLSANQPSEK